MSRHRGCERRTFLDVLADLQQDSLKIFVVLLLRQKLETLDQGQAGINHYRKLARKDRQVFRLNLLASTDFRNTDLATLFLNGSQRYLFAPQNLTQCFAIVRDAFADNDLI